MQFYYDSGLLKKRVLQDLEIWLPQWYPKGRGRKGYFEIGDIGGTPGDSLKICLSGAKRGLWYDFATAEGGDVFSLWGRNRGISGFGNILKTLPDITASVVVKSPEPRKNVAARIGGMFISMQTAI